eukprot:COSAG02_NODE_15_length_56565_cov_56.417136_4_plen_118_part_00
MPLSSPDSFVYAEIFCCSVSAYLPMFCQQETNPLSKVVLSPEPQPSESAVFERLLGTYRHDAINRFTQGGLDRKFVIGPNKSAREVIESLGTRRRTSNYDRLFHILVRLQPVQRDKV